MLVKQRTEFYRSLRLPSKYETSGGLTSRHNHFNERLHFGDPVSFVNLRIQTGGFTNGLCPWKMHFQFKF